MTTADLYQTLKISGAEFVFEDRKLRIRVPDGALTPEIREGIREQMPRLKTLAAIDRGRLTGFCVLHGRWLSLPEMEAGSCRCCDGRGQHSECCRNTQSTALEPGWPCVDCGAPLPAGRKYRCERCIPTKPPHHGGPHEESDAQDPEPAPSWTGRPAL